MHPIRLRGARTHNLQSVDLDLPPGQLVAITGPSGAGKSSLAIDTLYAEGQRRFVESFSPYARQFLERLERPPMDELDPVAATVAVDRRAPIKSSRSTLATLADLEPYLAALFSREAIPRCPDDGSAAQATTPGLLALDLCRELDGQRAVLSYPVRLHDAVEYLALREALARDGYRRLVVGGPKDSRLRDLDEVRPSEATAVGVTTEVVVDRVTLGHGELRRVQHAIEVAHERAGRLEVRTFSGRGGGQGEGDQVTGHRTLARGLACPTCGRTFDPPRPALFSYNSPAGACAACRGFGRTIDIDWDKVIPDPTRSLAAGAIKAWAGSSAEWERGELKRFCQRRRIPMTAPWSSLTAEQRALVIEGEGHWDEGKFPGVRRWFKWLEGRTYKMHVRVFLSRYREYVSCTSCHGARLNAAALGYHVDGLSLAGWHALTVAEATARVKALRPVDPQGRRVQAELAARLGYLEAVGLGYLTLDRQARTLSGGEAQRAGLTTALGATLTGALFVLDEPTVGLHASDVPALARVMRDLSRAGNTVLVIEHEAEVVRGCDRVIELGPAAGPAGGRVLFDGTPAELAGRLDLPTGQAWAERPEASRTRRAARGAIVIEGISIHNLKDVDVQVPLGVLCAVTGPSGSGKSTLVEDVLHAAVARALGNTAVPRPGDHRRLAGIEGIKATALVDQAPLGRTARGNPATYTKAWDRIRARFAAEPAAAAAGLGPSHFSFNSTGRAGAPAGRCEACSGEGYETIEMQFLADVSLLCPVCQGQRFKPEVLAIRHHDLSVAQVLAFTVDEALAQLSPRERPDTALIRALTPVTRVGLGYLPLGQPLSTLSGGEAQRLKLARALGERPAGTLFVVDEPSAGLHGRDAAQVIAALHALVDDGASVVVVDHDLDVIASADHVIDLGPGGGPDGGRVVATGTPEDVEQSGSRTGEALRARRGRRAAPRHHGARAADRGVGYGRQEAPGPTAIRVTGAREHNLRDVRCVIPHGQLCVVTGPSGSGKSSLAFDVIFAEGQRRYMETLTPYARQFLPALPRPEVDRVDGVPPSIALEQRTARGGGNSTVATVTEVAHYLRLLFAKVGTPHCPRCDTPVAALGADALYQRLVGGEGASAAHVVYAPAVRARKGTYLDVFTAAARAGLTHARVDDELVPIEPPPRLQKSREHSIDLVMHVGPLGALTRERFQHALSLGEGAIRVAPGKPSARPARGEALYSTRRACPSCGESVPELDPRWFSFNTKQGQCPACEGRGTAGEGDDPHARPCRECGGTRLAPVPRKVRLHDETYPAFLGRDVTSALERARALRFEGNDQLIAQAAHAELLRRLEFADQVGLGYLALDRAAASLSGGEMQRLRLSAQLGSGLTGALYVLDEPTIGLHPRDTRRLLDNLRALVATGSTVLVVEHDADTIRAADHLIDLGPGGGSHGGHIVAQGPAAEVLAHEGSPTGRALAEGPAARRSARPPGLEHIELRGAREHNLKDVDLRVPVGRLCVIAGVSGSGKSTLVRRVLYPALRRHLDLVADRPGAHRALKVPAGSVKRALAVDQSPIGRTPRSVPATFLGVWDEIRRLFAGLPEARARGFAASRFSFNSAGGGRCPACEGQGTIVAEMSFLPDVTSACEACGGARFEPATLEVQYAGLGVGDALHLTASEAARVFAAHPKIARPLAMLDELGVGYLQLGQGSHTLSGGEAQRLKLAAEVTAGAHHEATCYVLDEPTTGLHLSDVRRLVLALDRLVERGDTLVVIEHHPEVIAAADWVIELGPEGGARGGHILFEGAPRLLRKARTPTGRYLAAG